MKNITFREFLYNQVMWVGYVRLGGRYNPTPLILVAYSKSYVKSYMKLCQ